MWSSSSTQTPMVQPSSQLFGNGFGHSGSTSKIGAWTIGALRLGVPLQHGLPDAESEDARGERRAVENVRWRNNLSM